MILPVPVTAQQVNVSAPAVGVNQGFYEQWGTSWGFYQRSPQGYLFFNNGGMGGALPPFGGFQPNAGAQFGFGAANRNSGFHFQLFGSQGSSSSIVSQTPSLTVMNGATGSMFDGVVRPFVTGFVPVVGQQVWQAQPGPVTAPPGWKSRPPARWKPEDEEKLVSPPRGPARNFDDPPLILNGREAPAKTE